MSMIVIQAAAAVFACTLCLIGLGYLIFRPKTWKLPPSDILVLAAHQDDCVVLGGELALRALDAGKSVSILYLTCGAENAGMPRAKIRANEALAAWTAVGVPPQNLCFLGYRQSEIDGPCMISRSELLAATERIASAIRETGTGATVILPAAGESHVDHQELRRIGLQAIKEADRKDLMVLEAPEYNDSVSFIRSPGKAMQYFVKSLPLISRFAEWFDSAMFPGFVCGGVGFQLPDIDAIRSRKINMLRAFISEDPELLVRYFGWPSQFRPVKSLTSPGNECIGIPHVRFGEQQLDLSVIGLWIAIYLLGFGTSWFITQGFINYFPGVLWITLPSFCMIGLVFAGIRGRKRIETRLLFLVIALGIAIELFFMSWR